jgi:hypothetical protein
MNLREILANMPEQMTKEELTRIITTIYTQNPALDKPHPNYETDTEVAADLLAGKEPICGELDDEYLPTCCRNGNSHRHPV